MFAFAQHVLRLSFAASLLALAGCGASAPQNPKAPVAKGVFTSASDCAGAAILSLEECSDVIEKAVADHERTSPSYSSQKACESAEGADKCERTEAKRFRPRLSAFMIVAAEPPFARPLYPSDGTSVSFRTADKTVLSSDDDNVPFSRPAMAAAEGFLNKKKTSSR